MTLRRPPPGLLRTSRTLHSPSSDTPVAVQLPCIADCHSFVKPHDDRSIGYEGKCLEERALRGMYGFLKIIRPTKEALSYLIKQGRVYEELA